ncbi:MAG: type II toxin-antitoxin system RelE/ParE family toxin [Planctomycetota bacterium]|nr:type II toxin-antitoxin system RelE/ParE family toxin [Planctomycetota bacterium]
MASGEQAIYDIAIKRAAQRDIRPLSKKLKVRIDRAITSLASDPRPPTSIPLTGHDGLFRIRLGDYRLIYGVDWGARVVNIERVRPRGEAYENL